MTAPDTDLPQVGDTVFNQPWNDSTAVAVVTKVEEDEYWTEIRFKVSAATVWTSPPVQHSHEPYAFGTWFDGTGLPVWFGDIDADGSPELLAPIPKADIAPTIFRVFRWNGSELALLGISTLIQKEQGQFRWAPPTEIEESGTWLEHFDNGRAIITHFNGEEATTSTTPVVPVKGGFDAIAEESEPSLN